MTLKEALKRITQHQDIDQDSMMSIMRLIMSGQCQDAAIAGFLAALAVKKEVVSEITGAARIMNQLLKPVELDIDPLGPLIDMVGTGGDGAQLFNVSTASVFVVAAAGGYVAKHGNRSISSNSGSADVLERMGIHLDLTCQQIGQCIEQIGIGFMFAPNHHPAMKYASPARQALGIRTLFNILGPLTNPARVKRQLIGVYSKALCLPVAKAMQHMGSHHVWVVHSEDGLDEISLAEPTHVVELKDSHIHSFTLTPETLGIARQSLNGLQVEDAQQSYAIICEALAKGDQHPKAQNLIALNAGIGLYIADLCPTMQAGVNKAQYILQQGLALEKMHALSHLSKQLTNSGEPL